MSEQVLIRKMIANAPDVLASGFIDTVLNGTDAGFSEQVITPRHLTCGKSRFPPGVLLTCESSEGHPYMIKPMIKEPAPYGFKISVAHNIPSGISLAIRIIWLAYVYSTAYQIIGKLYQPFDLNPFVSASFACSADSCLVDTQTCFSGDIVPVCLCDSDFRCGYHFTCNCDLDLGCGRDGYTDCLCDVNCGCDGQDECQPCNTCNVCEGCDVQGQPGTPCQPCNTCNVCEGCDVQGQPGTPCTPCDVCDICEGCDVDYEPGTCPCNEDEGCGRHQFTPCLCDMNCGCDGQDEFVCVCEENIGCGSDFKV